MTATEKAQAIRWQKIAAQDHRRVMQLMEYTRTKRRALVTAQEDASFSYATARKYMGLAGMTRARKIEAVIGDWLDGEGDGWEKDNASGDYEVQIILSIADQTVASTSVRLNLQSLAEAIDAEFDRIAKETI